MRKNANWANRAMKRRLGLIVTIAILASWSPQGLSTASAGPPTRVVATLENISYDDLGLTSVRQVAAGYAVQTTALRATATVACDDGDGCSALDGALVSITQELGIVIVGDILSPVIRGTSRGEITLTLNDVVIVKEFSGRVLGEGQCDPNGCDVALGISTEPGAGWKAAIDLAGSLTVDGDVPSWTSLEGSGVVRIVIDVIGAG